VRPIAAARKLTSSDGTTLDKLNVIESNEAFVSRAVATLHEVDLDPFRHPRVNRKGGAIALGHPLGMSGAWILMSAVDNQRPANGKAAT
jgi:acetyl-CoA acetyltransferase